MRVLVYPPATEARYGQAREEDQLRWRELVDEGAGCSGFGAESGCDEDTEQVAIGRGAMTALWR